MAALAVQNKTTGELSTASVKPAIQFEIYDTGIGISQEN
jgi:signal transduction histidine kinase